MIKALRLVPVVLALSAGCSSGGEVACKPCAPPVTVTVGGLDRHAGQAWRLRVCVGGRPCTDVAVPASRTDSGAMWIPLDSLDLGSFAGLPVRVTASGKGRDDLHGTGTMRFTDDRGTCPCDHSNAAVTLA
ncbi:hypothetical protein E1293_38100 [Actinomadura darangshiensis]|uniref:Uncharacterized protein n=1 Tax=Actinomadura darangshiensis TaxID=705336 RepID=A0A4R5AC54_9ACTN|nr:hypothetical protein [Actinomadura darangshiensis]TDD67352.1 hypothetical protein E1293_38100 [Actinomadura darangshiensis]